MDPLIIHHVIRHRLSRIETSNFQDKSGCSINGIRSFLFEQGIVQDLDDMEKFIHHYVTFQDYRGYPIRIGMNTLKNYPLSDEILKMKNVRFEFENQPKPNHKLVSPEPHFAEEERNLIENHFKYLGSRYESEDIEQWKCFEIDNEGHLVSIHHRYPHRFQLSNESIEHLSNFPHLRNLAVNVRYEGNVTNFSLLSTLSRLLVGFEREYEDPELFKDLGLFSNLLYLYCSSHQPGILLNREQ